MPAWSGLTSQSSSSVSGSSVPLLVLSGFSPHPAPATATAAASRIASALVLSPVNAASSGSFASRPLPARAPPRNLALQPLEQGEERDRHRRQHHDGGEEPRRQELGRRGQHQVPQP